MFHNFVSLFLWISGLFSTFLRTKREFNFYVLILRKNECSLSLMRLMKGSSSSFLVDNTFVLSYPRAHTSPISLTFVESESCVVFRCCESLKSQTVFLILSDMLSTALTLSFTRALALHCKDSSCCFVSWSFSPTGNTYSLSATRPDPFVTSWSLPLMRSGTSVVDREMVFVCTVPSFCCRLM